MNRENVHYDVRMSYQNSKRHKLCDNTGYSYLLVYFQCRYHNVTCQGISSNMRVHQNECGKR